MTPSDIEVLIHYHVCPRPHPRLGSIDVSDAIRYFLAKGLIQPDPCVPNVYKTTEGGQVLIDALCAVPLPFQVTEWRMPEVKCQQ